MSVKEEEYVIVGHSDDTDANFNLPRNISLVFAANEGETCTVPGKHDSILKEVRTIMLNDRVVSTSKNYTISFNPNTTDGIYKLNLNDDSYSLTRIDTIHNNTTLQEYIKRVINTNPGKKNIYCIFCRGGNPEYFEILGKTINADGLTSTILDNGPPIYYSGGRVKLIKKTRKTRKTRKSRKTRKTRKTKII
jgi:hypothetical protein